MTAQRSSVSTTLSFARPERPLHSDHSVVSEIKRFLRRGREVIEGVERVLDVTTCHLNAAHLTDIIRRSLDYPPIDFGVPEFGHGIDAAVLQRFEEVAHDLHVG